jgi:hypothetical protein
MMAMPTNILAMAVGLWVVVALVLGLLALTLLRAHRDLVLLIWGKGKLGSGWPRVWAVGWVTCLEAWSMRIWLLVPLWLVLSLILCLTVQPYRPIERMSLVLQMLLRSQEFTVLMVAGILGCMSLARERERRTLMTTVSKPISRLELLLGKVVGLSVMLGALLLVMGGISLTVALVTDRMVRNEAQAIHELQRMDYDRAARTDPPDESLLTLAQRGALRAENYILAPGGVQVAGMVDYTRNPPQRWLKGASGQKAIYRFNSLTAVVGIRPLLAFRFNGMVTTPTGGLLNPPEINVVITLINDSRTREEKTLRLSEAWTATWTPELLKFFCINPEFDPGPVEITVTCPTNNVFLGIESSTAREAANVVLIGADPNRTRSKNEFDTPLFSPQLLGTEKRDRQYIYCPAEPTPLNLLEVASYRFINVQRQQVQVDAEDKFTLTLEVDVDRYRAQSQSTRALLMAYSPLWSDSSGAGTQPGGAAANTQPDSIRRLDEKNIVTLPLVVTEKSPLEIKLPASLLDTGELLVDIRCLTPDHGIGFDQRSLRIQQPSGWFIANLAKSQAVLWLEATLLALVAVVCSSRMGWAVAGLTTLLIYTLGSSLGLLEEMVNGPSFSIMSNADAKALQGVWWYDAASGLSDISVRSVVTAAQILPNFARFDGMTALTQLRALPWFDLATMVLLAVVYTLPLLALGYLILRDQEVA